MENEKKDKKKKKKKALYKTVTVIGYVFLIVGLLIIAPVICPPIFGYHTYTVAEDQTGLVGSRGTLVYAYEADSYSAGNLVAVDNEDGDRDVAVYYIESASDDSYALENGETVSGERIVGRIVAKTPFFGYLSCLCFSTVGIIVTVVIFVIGIALAAYANRLARKQPKKADNDAEAQKA